MAWGGSWGVLFVVIKSDVSLPHFGFRCLSILLMPASDLVLLYGFHLSWEHELSSDLAWSAAVCQVRPSKEVRKNGNWKPWLPSCLVPVQWGTGRSVMSDATLGTLQRPLGPSELDARIAASLQEKSQPCAGLQPVPMAVPWGNMSSALLPLTFPCTWL